MTLLALLRRRLWRQAVAEVKMCRIVDQRLLSSTRRWLNHAFNGRSSFRSTRAKRRSDMADDAGVAEEEVTSWDRRAGTDLELFTRAWHRTGLMILSWRGGANAD